MISDRLNSLCFEVSLGLFRRDVTQADFPLFLALQRRVYEAKEVLLEVGLHVTTSGTTLPERLFLLQLVASFGLSYPASFPSSILALSRHRVRQTYLLILLL